MNNKKRAWLVRIVALVCVIILFAAVLIPVLASR